MTQKLFITDFDGTLLTDEKTIHPKDISTLEKLQQKGVVTAIATGRSLYSFEKALTLLQTSRKLDRLPVDYLLFSTGAGILEFKTGQIIYKKEISSSGLGPITDYFDCRKTDYMIHAAIPHTRNFVYRSFGRDNPDFYHRIKMYEKYARTLKNGHPYSHPATEVLAIVPRQKGFGVVESAAEKLSGFSVIHATSPLDHESIWIEVFHKDVSKSRTAGVLAQKIGGRPEDTASVGNDYNDQDLLDWSGAGFMVENGPGLLKSRYTPVSSNNQCGVTQAAMQTGWMD